MKGAPPALGAAIGVALLAVAGPSGAQEVLPRGALTERVTCRAAPDQSYALYLPASYTPERGWPILYVLDARGRAVDPPRRFERAAASWGWIVASSYGTRSDAETEPSLRALRALFADTRERFSLDERRVYLAGFSGMARLAVTAAANGRGAIAGVIGVGAGFPDGLPPRRDLSFAWYGAAGARDFNYGEMRDVEARLSALSLPHRFRPFDGGHEWPPAQVCGDAVAWMELQAARRGARPRSDPAFDGLLRDRTEAASALQSSGRVLEAFRDWRDLARDFETLAEVGAADRRARELERSPEVRRALKEESRLRAAERAEIGRAERVLREALNQVPLPPAVTVAGDLRVDHWRREAAAGPSSPRAQMAERVLAKIFVQTAYYLPLRFAQSGEKERAVFVLTLATAVRPEEPSAWMGLARAQARAGRRGAAREAAMTAMERGATPAEVAADPEIAPLLQSDAMGRYPMDHSNGFQNLVKDAKSRIRETTPEEVRTRQERGEEFHLVDVREDGEWARGHIAGATHLGKGVIERDVEKRIPDNDAEIILYCGGGYRSALAADALQKMGYRNVISMDGGWKKWRDLGYPTEE